MGGRGRRRRPKETKPFDTKKEKNLRNLLIVGFVRSCQAPQLPTKFFDCFNLYYQQFDRWDWDFFRSNWTSKKNDIMTIKRGKRGNSKWKNMYGKKWIKMDPRKDKSPRKFTWKLRLLDRRQIASTKKKDDDENADEEDNNNNNTERNGNSHNKNKDKKNKEIKKESFEIQYMDVLVGVVNTEKLPNQEMSRSFNQYSCGHALFAGNGKIYKFQEKEWIKVFRPIKHEDTLSINLEWMTIGKYKELYVTEKELEKEKQKKGGATSRTKDDDYCIALTFNKNDKYDRYPKGAAFMLPWSSPYKLAVSSAKKRWEIEWISANWIDEDPNKDKKITNDDDDDNKEPN